MLQDNEYMGNILRLMTFPDRIMLMLTRRFALFDPKVRGFSDVATFLVMRVVVLFILSLSTASIPSIAVAQEFPTAKEFDLYTSGGVDIFTGQFRLFSNDISVGSGDFPSRLELVRENTQLPRFPGLAYATHNLSLSANCSPCIEGIGENRLTVKAFDGTHIFTSPYVAWGNSRTWTNMGLDGAEVIDNGSNLEFRSKYGDQIFFAPTSANGTGVGCYIYCRVPVYAVVASGESIVFRYENVTTNGWPGSRLTKVTNSRGYGFQFGYMNPSATTGNAYQRTLLTSVAAYRSGCVPIAVSCDTGVLGNVSYTWAYVGNNAVGTELYRMMSFSNLQGRVLNYEYEGYDHRLSAAVFADTSSQKIFQITYAPVSVPNDCREGKVVELKDALLRATQFSTSYCYSSPRDSPVTVITAPDGMETTYNFTGSFDGAIIGVPTSIEMPLGRTLIYNYNAGRLENSTDAEGITVSRALDMRGNVTQMTILPKAESGERTTTAGFALCDGVNFRRCNKPYYTVDARGFRTDFQYSNVHGMIAVELLPADANNVRPVKRYSYSSFYPAPGVEAPPGVNLTDAYMLTRTDTCLNSAVTNTQIDFTYVCPSGSRIRTNFLYTASTSAARTSYELEGLVEDADGAGMRTCYRYDVVGNMIAETAPRAGLSICH